MMWILLVLALVIIAVLLYIFLGEEKFFTSPKAAMPSSGAHTPRSGQHHFAADLGKIHFHQPQLHALVQEVHKKIIGMDAFVHAIILNMLCGGHMLIEGVPGLAKTKTIHTFAQSMGLEFTRIQFTPDMLPADIVGTEIYDAQHQHFEAKLGPIMSNIILADEINRATPKVQSALLESMQEKQVSIGGKTFPLPDPFMVLATQNPLDQEGTYALPEAQIDRFLFKIIVGYPSIHEEKKILDEMEHDEIIHIQELISHEEFLSLRAHIQTITISDQVKDYITRLVDATRSHELLSYGSSPRGSIGIMLASKALAACEGREFVTHEDVQRVCLPVLRHRVVLSYTSKRAGKTADAILLELLEQVKI